MSYTDHLSELEALRSQVADLSRALAERDQLMDVERRHHEGEIRDLREQSELLRSIVEGTATEAGNDCFASLVTHLTSTLQVQYAVIGEVSDGLPKKIRTVAVSAGGTLVDNFEYDLAHTPCATALAQTFACFSRDVQTTFPLFSCLADLGAESYCAVSLRAKDGSTIGLLVVMDTKPLENSDYLRSLLEVFAPRIAAEFERRQAERERAQALADLHNVIEAIPDIVFAFDTQGNMMKWNRRVVDVTGYSPEELLNKPALAFVPPEEQDNIAAAIQRAFTEGYAELEGHLLTKDRRLIPYHWTGALLKNLHGEPIGITGVGRDVFDRKRAEEALRVSEERFALAVEGSSDILWDATRLSGEPWYAPQTQIWWSPRVRELLGLQESDSFETFEQWVARLHPDDKDRVFGQLAAHIEQRVPYDVEYRLRTNAGDYRWIRGRGQALWDEQGEPSRMSGSCQDITERKGVEEAFRASEERWELAVRGSNDGIWDWDIQSGTVFFSPRWKAMRGFGEYEITSHVEEWQSRIHPDDLDRVLQNLNAYVTKQTPDFCEEYRTQRKDGSYMWILDRGLALWADDGTPLRMVGSESDITEHKQALLRLAEQESLLRSILDTEPECVNRVADDGTILQMNKAGLCFIEADSFEQVAGRSVYDFVAPEFLERYRSMHEAVIRGASQQFEFQIVGLKGTRRWMETHAVPLLNPVDHRMEHLAITRDITHRKRTETALRESEERYRTLVDLSPNGVFVYCNGKKVYVNQAACAILGAASPEQLLDNPTFHFSHPDDHASIRDSIAQILAAGEPVRRVERKYQRLDGTAIFVEVDAGRIMWIGEPAIQVIFADITERKQAEEALRKSEAQFRALAESTTDWMWEIDEQGRFTYCSPKIQDILGYEPNHALGKTPFDFMPEEEARRVVGLFGPIAAARKPFAGIENTNRHKDGRLVILECRGTPVIDDNGLFRGYRGFDQDITERKRSEEALRESEERFRAIVEASPIGIFMIDPGGSVTYGNAADLRMTGLSWEDTLGTRWIKAIHPEDREQVLTKWQAAMEQGKPYIGTGRYLHEDGTIVWWDVQTVAVRVSGRLLGHVGLVVDITDRKLAEESLQQSWLFLQSFVEHTPAAVAMLDRDLKYVEVSKRWYQDYQLSERSIIGLHHYDVFPEIKKMEHWQAIHRRCLAGEILRSNEDRLVREDGKEDWLRWEIRPWTDAAGSIGGIIMFTEVITDRKQAEEALRGSEERLRLSLEAANQGIYDLNVQSGEALVSSGYATMLGYDPATFHETHAAWIERLHPDDRDRVTEYYRAYVAGTIPEYRVEFRQRTRGRGWRWILSLGRIVERDARGEPLRMLGTHTDITERKQMEEALRASEDRFNLAVRGSNTGIWDWDLRTGKTYFSPLWKSMLGYEEHELRGELFEWEERLHPDDRKRSSATVRAYLEGATSQYELEHRLRHKNGSYRWIMARGVSICDTEGKPYRMAGSHIDITEQKQTQEALANSERQLRTVLDALPVGVWFTDQSGRPLLSNLAAKQIWSGIRRVGIDTDGNAAGWWEATGPSGELHGWALSQALTKGILSLHESLDLECLDGTKKTIRNSTVPVRDEAGGILGAIVLNEDITLLRQAQAALQLTQFSVDHAVEGFLWIGPDARIFHVNDSICRMLEYTWEELTALTLYDIDPNLSSEVWPAHWEELKEKGSLTFESKYWSRTGRVLDLEVTVNYLQYEGKEYNCTIMRDIGERRRAEDALWKSEARLRTITDAVPGAVYQYQLSADGTQQFLFMSQGIQMLVGVTSAKGETDFSSIWNRVLPEDVGDLWASIRESSETLLPWKHEFRIVHTDGATRWISGNSIPESPRDDGSILWNGILIDITERKRVEETLHQRERDLRAALDERERISQELHDGILQSLFAVGLTLEATKLLMPLKGRAVSGPSLDQAIKQLNLVMGEIRNFIAGLGSDLLKGKDISAVLHQMLAPLTENQPTRVRVAVEGRAAKALSTEQSLHLIRVIQEAVSNCIKHGHAQEARVSLKMLKRGVRLSIRDNGCGFNQDVAMGIGHGLANMAARAQKIGGRFTVFSKENVGTRIVLDMPDKASNVSR
jgi:PAS domain S-box-containing protein